MYTKPRWEKKVAELLAKRKISNYCPLNKVVRQWTDRKKTILEPLFSSYVFVHVSEAEHLAVRQTDGILNFVYWLGKPAQIKDEEIEAIRAFLTEHDNVKLEKIRVNVSDRIRIIEGPLMHREGAVLEVYQKSVKAYLPSLGYAMIAEVSKAKIEVIDQLPTVYNEPQYNVNAI